MGLSKLVGAHCGICLRKGCPGHNVYETTSDPRAVRAYQTKGAGTGWSKHRKSNWTWS